MRPELLTIPSRRSSNFPELHSFFEQFAGGGPEDMLVNFVHAFAGTNIEVPGPDFLKELDRDEQMVAALGEDSSAETRIKLMQQHNVTHQHLAEIWEACTGKRLEPPPTATRQEAIEQATALMTRYKRRRADIIMMYQLTPAEHVDAAAAKEQAERPQITDTQQSAMRALKSIGKAATRQELANAMKQTVNVRTIDALINVGLVETTATGRFRLTKAGKRF